MDLKDITAVGKALSEPINKAVNNVLDKPTKELGEGIGDLFWMVFSPIHKARMVQELKIQAYIKEIERELTKIPADKAVTPPLNIVGPALEASKYYIDNEELRKMFAKLIASASNSDLSSTVHPSFIEIIKQLSPLDAQVLNTLASNMEFPIARFYSRGNKMKTTDVDKISFIQLFYTEIMPFVDMDLSNHEIYSASVQNISRLSIIEIDYRSSFANDDIYDQLVDFYKKAQNEFQKEIQSIDKYPEFQGQQLELLKGSWHFTDLGHMFIRCCLYDDSLHVQQH